MRLAMPIAALIAAATLAACGSVAAPKPDPAGDAAFVTTLKQLCAKAPPLAQISTTASMAALTSAANANNTTANNLDTGLVKLTRSLSGTSPLAPAITDLAFMLVDMSARYQSIVSAAKTDDTGLLDLWVPLAIMRANQARSDLAKIGVSGCLS
jgi:hypothetical protein